MEPVDVRLLTAEDAAAYWQFRLEYLKAKPAAFTSSPEEHRALTVEAMKERLSADPANGFVVGAFKGGALV